MSSMVNACDSIFSILSLSKWNTNNVYNMKGRFQKSELLISLPDISIYKLIINMIWVTCFVIAIH